MPKKKIKKRKKLLTLIHEKRTIIFCESPKRILKTLEEIVNVFGPKRNITLARELTKIWESINKSKTLNLLNMVKLNKNNRKGEIILIIEGYKKKEKSITKDVIKTLFFLKKSLSFKQSIKLTSKIYKIKKNNLYQYAIKKNYNNT